MRINGENASTPRNASGRPKVKKTKKSPKAIRKKIKNPNPCKYDRIRSMCEDSDSDDEFDCGVPRHVPSREPTSSRMAIAQFLKESSQRRRKAGASQRQVDSADYVSSVQTRAQQLRLSSSSQSD